jgi:predicted nucleic acid-binding protein
MLVIDASALADMLLDLRAAARIRNHIADYSDALHVPHLLDLEVLSVLGRLVGSGVVSPDHARAAVSDLLALPLERYPHAILAARVWELRENFSAYDAVYLALAETLHDEGVPLLTSDARLARAARKHTDVEILLAA